MAGFRISVTARGRADGERLSHYMASVKGYLVAGAHTPDFTVIIDDDLAPPHAHELSETSATIRYRSTPDELCFCDEYSWGRISWGNRILHTRWNGKSEFERYTSAEMKLVLSFLVIERGGILLHGSAVRRHGYAVAFIGHSGSGKTTAAKLMAPEWQILNDECNIVLPALDCAGYRIHATPFTAISKLPSLAQGSAHLGAVFTLARGRDVQIRPLSAQRSILSVVGSTVAIPSTDAVGERVLSNASEVVRSIPIEELSFRRDSAISEAIEDYLELGWQKCQYTRLSKV